LGKPIYYCFQDEGDDYGGIMFYRSSEDFEPSHEVMIKKPTFFEKPEGYTDLEKKVRIYMKQHPNIKFIPKGELK
jgi:hypothetical protein